MTDWIERMKARALRLKSDIVALYYAARHPGTPWYAKLLIAAIVAYALSPIDLIPDFIPVLGLLDDIILLPLGIVLAAKMIPPPVMQECRERASRSGAVQSKSGRVAAVCIVLMWLMFVIG